MVAASKTFEAFSISHAALLDRSTGAELHDIYGVRNATLTADVGNWDNTGDDRTLSRWNWLNHATLAIQGGFMSFDMMEAVSGNATTTNAAGTKAHIIFTPEAAGADAWDYSTTSAISFTVDDGTGPTTVALSTDLLSVSGVTTAIDTALGTGYVVTTVGDTVKIEAAAAGHKVLLVGGTDAADITGSANFSSVVGTAVDEFSQLLWDDQCANQGAWPVLLRMASKDKYKVARQFDIAVFQCEFGPFSFGGPTYRTGLEFNATGTCTLTDRDETGTLLPTRSNGAQIEAVARMVNRPQPA